MGSLVSYPARLSSVTVSDAALFPIISGRGEHKIALFRGLFARVTTAELRQISSSQRSIPVGS